MARKKKVEFKKEALYSSVGNSAQEIFNKIGINNAMSKTVMIQTARAYIDNQSNPVRACNAILLKLGVPVQFNAEMRKSRVYALTALDEATTQGVNFDPKSVLSIAEKRLEKLNTILGKDISVQEEKEVSTSKSSIAREIYASMSDKKTGDIVREISERLNIEKQSAYGYYYSAKRALTV